jgi:hypothetical protein
MKTGGGKTPESLIKDFAPLLHEYNTGLHPRSVLSISSHYTVTAVFRLLHRKLLQLSACSVCFQQLIVGILPSLFQVKGMLINLSFGLIWAFITLPGDVIYTNIIMYAKGKTHGEASPR